jgi:hypothetical protein
MICCPDSREIPVASMTCWTRDSEIETVFSV